MFWFRSGVTDEWKTSTNTLLWDKKEKDETSDYQNTIILLPSQQKEILKIGKCIRVHLRPPWIRGSTRWVDCIRIYSDRCLTNNVHPLHILRAMFNVEWILFSSVINCLANQKLPSRNTSRWNRIPGSQKKMCDLGVEISFVAVACSNSFWLYFYSYLNCSLSKLLLNKLGS